MPKKNVERRSYNFEIRAEQDEGREMILSAEIFELFAILSLQISITYAPRLFTSRILLSIFSKRSSEVAIAITGVPFSISDIVPCFSSPAA